MPENPYQPPKKANEPSEWQWPPLELVMLYVVGIPLIALIVSCGLFAWLFRISD